MKIQVFKLELPVSFHCATTRFIFVFHLCFQQFRYFASNNIIKWFIHTHSVLYAFYLIHNRQKLKPKLITLLVLCNWSNLTTSNSSTKLWIAHSVNGKHRKIQSFLVMGIRMYSPNFNTIIKYEQHSHRAIAPTLSENSKSTWIKNTCLCVWTIAIVWMMQNTLCMS